MSRPIAAALVALLLAACQAVPAPVEILDPRIGLGALRSCAELGLSDVRCTLVRLRAARTLQDARPDAVVTSQVLHEAGAAPAGQSPIPRSQLVAAVVVFTMNDGSRVGVPVLCPTDPSGADRTCDPRIR